MAPGIGDLRLVEADLAGDGVADDQDLVTLDPVTPLSMADAVGRLPASKRVTWIRGLYLDALIVVGALRGIGLAPTAVPPISDRLGGDSQRCQALPARVVFSSTASSLEFTIALGARHAIAASSSPGKLRWRRRPSPACKGILRFRDDLGPALMQGTTAEHEAADRTPDATLGHFNYIDSATESSLRRNGKVFLRRDSDGDDSGLQGVTMSQHSVEVSDARRLREQPTLAQDGFELLQRPLADSDLDFYDQQQVLQRYYPECVRLLERHTGARAFAFDHNVRSVQGKKLQRRITGGQQVQEPLHMVHGDYTLTSGPQRLRDLARPPAGNDTLRAVLGDSDTLIPTDLLDRALAEGGRFAIVNVWRNIAPEPVAVHPLALCNNRSVDPADLVVFEIHYSDRIGENYFAKPAKEHRWYYYPAMTRDEALLIKQWDSAGTLARSDGRDGDGADREAPTTFTLHSAFEDPATPTDARDRQSIEVRCVLLYH